SLGAAAGALSMMRWRPTYAARVGFACLTTQAISLPVLGFGSLWLAGVACLVIGVTAGVASALLGAVFVTTVDGRHLGRMASIQRLGDEVLMPVAMVAFGVLAMATSVSLTFAVFGITMGLLMVWPLTNRTLSTMTLAKAQARRPITAR